MSHQSGGGGAPAGRDYSSLPREEPEKIKKWREEQKLRLEAKGDYTHLTVRVKNLPGSLTNWFVDQEEEKKKKEMRENAKKELEEWYKHHKEAIEKTRLANR